MASSQSVAPGTWRTKHPLVSVVIPCFNAADTIKRAIESVLQQDYCPLEIIVVDDESDDASVAIISETLKGKNSSKVIKLLKNKGAAAARNAGISVAKGEFVAFLDSDDIWLPGKITAQVMVLIARPRVSLVTCNTRKLSAEGETLLAGYDVRPPFEGATAWKGLLAYNFVPTPTVMTRAEILSEVGGFNESMVVGEDLDLWIRIALRGELVALPKIYVHYYDYADSLMKRHSRSSAPFIMEMILRHMSVNESKLTKREFRRLLGRRSFELGNHAFEALDFGSSQTLYWRALVGGYSPVNTVGRLLISTVGRAWQACVGFVLRRQELRPDQKEPL